MRYKGFLILQIPEDNTWDIWDDTAMNWVESGLETLQDALLWVDEVTA